MTEPHTKLEYDERILRALRRIIRAVDLYSRRLAHRHTLTGPQLVCLRRLHKDGAMSSGQLAKEVSLSPATVTGICDRLEARGLVARARKPEDKRQVVVSLTEAGRALAENVPLPLHENFTARLAALPEDEQIQIREVLERVVAMMEAEDVDSTPLYGAPPAFSGIASLPEFMQPDDAPAESSAESAR